MVNIHLRWPEQEFRGVPQNSPRTGANSQDPIRHKKIIENHSTKLDEKSKVEDSNVNINLVRWSGLATIIGTVLLGSTAVTEYLLFPENAVFSVITAPPG